MKILDIAFQDMLRAFRSATAIVFMLGIPLLVTGMFYFMFSFGNIGGGGFSLPKTKVIVANLDAGGPKFQSSTKSIPGSEGARTMGELVVRILQGEELAELIDITLAPSAESARAAVDTQASQVAIIIPADFSKKFADPDAQAVIEFYQDPTLTIGPGIIRAILNRFMDGMAGVKIAVNIFLDEAKPEEYGMVAQVIRLYIDRSLTDKEDAASELVKTNTPSAQPANTDFMMSMISSIMAGMMVFYAFFTGASTAQSILKEEEERTLPRLFTTPTPQAVILSGKFLAVFLTVLVQVVTLILVAQLIFGIKWGEPVSVTLAAIGVVFSASSFGILLTSFMKSTKQGGIMFGGVLTMTGMLGMISVFMPNSPASAQLGETVGLLVPQGWAIRGVMRAMNSAPFQEIAVSLFVLLALSVAFFIIGVWRFNKRYA